MRYRYAHQYDRNRVYLMVRKARATQLGRSNVLGLLAITKKDIFAGRFRCLFSLTTPGLSIMSVHRFVFPTTTRDVAIRRTVTQVFSSVVQTLGLKRADHLPCAGAYPSSLDGTICERSRRLEPRYLPSSPWRKNAGAEEPWRCSMRIFLNIVAVLMLGVGGVWFLQGFNVLRQSVMSGHKRWIVIGALLIVVGIVILVFANRRKGKPPAS